MKRFLMYMMYMCIVISVIAGGFLFFQILNETERTEDNQIFKIGVIGPLTGSASAYGQWIRTGVEAAIEDQNKDTSKKIKVYFEDDQGDPKKAVSAYQKLKSIDNIDAVISVLTSNTLALKPLVEADKIVLMTPVASHPNITEGSNYVFRNTINSAQEAEAMVSYLNNNGKAINDICIVFINDPGGIASRDAFKTTFKGTIIDLIPFEKMMSDFRGVALKVADKCKTASALYVTGYGKEMGGVIRDIRQQGIGQQIYANQGIENKDVLNILGKLAVGIEYTFLPVGNNIPESILSREKMPSPAVLMAYEAVNIFEDAHVKATQENKPIIEILYNSQFNGVLSTIKFNEKGDVNRPIAIKRVGENMQIEQLLLINENE